MPQLILLATLALALFTGCRSSLSTSGPADSSERPVLTSEQLRDRAVLIALLEKLESDKDFVPALDKRTRRGSLLIINPPLTLSPSRTNAFHTQISADTDDRIQRSLLDVFDRRNRLNANLDLQSLDLPKRFLILRDQDLSRPLYPWEFRERFPTARAWVQPYHPAYSQDGSHAFIRAHIGPSSHSAAVNALLRLDQDKWKILFYRIAWYA